MKKYLSLFIIILINLTVSSQSKDNYTQLDSTSVFFLNRISQHTAPCYKMYKTQNMWTFLELETFSGRIWQVQYSVNDDKGPRMKVCLNYRNLVNSDEDTFAGRFELYPTENMYNFILLDTLTGRTWQAQWAMEYYNRGIFEIE